MVSLSEGVSRRAAATAWLDRSREYMTCVRIPSQAAVLGQSSDLRSAPHDPRMAEVRCAALRVPGPAYLSSSQGAVERGEGTQGRSPASGISCPASQRRRHRHQPAPAPRADPTLRATRLHTCITTSAPVRRSTVGLACRGTGPPATAQFPAHRAGRRAAAKSVVPASANVCRPSRTTAGTR